MYQICLELVTGEKLVENLSRSEERELIEVGRTLPIPDGAGNVVITREESPRVKNLVKVITNIRLEAKSLVDVFHRETEEGALLVRVDVGDRNNLHDAERLAKCWRKVKRKVEKLSPRPNPPPGQGEGWTDLGVHLRIAWRDQTCRLAIVEGGLRRHIKLARKDRVGNAITATLKQVLLLLVIQRNISLICGLEEGAALISRNQIADFRKILHPKLFGQILNLRLDVLEDIDTGVLHLFVELLHLRSKLRLTRGNVIQRRHAVVIFLSHGSDFYGLSYLTPPNLAHCFWNSRKIFGFLNKNFREKY